MIIDDTSRKINDKFPDLALYSVRAYLRFFKLVLVRSANINHVILSCYDASDITVIRGADWRRTGANLLPASCRSRKGS